MNTDLLYAARPRASGATPVLSDRDRRLVERLGRSAPARRDVRIIQARTGTGGRALRALPSANARRAGAGLAVLMLGCAFADLWLVATGAGYPALPVVLAVAVAVMAAVQALLAIASHARQAARARLSALFDLIAGETDGSAAPEGRRHEDNAAPALSFA